MKKIASTYLVVTSALLVSVFFFTFFDSNTEQVIHVTESLTEPNKEPLGIQEIRLPEDHHPHNNSIEWWYYNGHLNDSKGNPFGFHAVIFRGRSGTSQIGYMSHTSLTDINNQKHYQSTKLGNTATNTNYWYSFTNDDWKIEATDNYHKVVVSSANHTLNLNMIGSGDVMLHNSSGYISDENGWTYYYTEPNLETSGQLTLNGEISDVVGSSWMDHQWGEFTVAGYPSGWQWFGMQLPNNQYLMLSESRTTDANRSTYATFRDSSGSTHHVSQEDIELITLDYWASSKTNAIYPRKWILSIKKHSILLEIESAVADQELTEAFPPQTIYWEGVATISGIINGYYFTEKDDYRAFVELVGYVDTESIVIKKE